MLHSEALSILHVKYLLGSKLIANIDKNGYTFDVKFTKKSIPNISDDLHSLLGSDDKYICSYYDFSSVPSSTMEEAMTNLIAYIKNFVALAEKDVNACLEKIKKEDLRAKEFNIAYLRLKVA